MSTKVALSGALVFLAGAGGLAWLLEACEPDDKAFHGVVWEDVDGDGELDDGEPTIPNVSVQLLCGTAALFGEPATESDLESCLQSSTDAAGEYRFPSGVEADIFTEVQLLFVPGPDWMFVPLGGGSHVDPTTGRSEETFSADEGAEVNAGLSRVAAVADLPNDAAQPPVTAASAADTVPEPPPLPPVSAAPIPPPATGAIGDLVWYDQDGDALQDPGEVNPEFRILSVTLYDEAGTTLATTNVDPAGGYQFTGLAAGTYRVQFTLPGNGRFAFVAPDAGDDTLDSDVDPASGQTQVVLAVGETNTSIDAGIEFTG